MKKYNLNKILYFTFNNLLQSTGIKYQFIVVAKKLALPSPITHDFLVFWW